MPSYQSGFGNVYSLKSNVEKSTWRSMGQTPIPTGRKAIHSHPRKFAETVYKVFARKGWRSSTGIDRKVWQCSERYKVKGVMGCANRYVEEETLIKAYLMAWNALVENREDFMEQWTEQLQSENLLEGYRAEKFIEYTDGAEPLTEMDTDFMLKTLDHIKVFEDGTLLVVFLDGTEIECKNEEE